MKAEARSFLSNHIYIYTHPVEQEISLLGGVYIMRETYCSLFFISGSRVRVDAPGHQFILAKFEFFQICHVG